MVALRGRVLSGTGTWWHQGGIAGGWQTARASWLLLHIQGALVGGLLVTLATLLLATLHSYTGLRRKRLRGEGQAGVLRSGRVTAHHGTTISTPPSKPTIQASHSSQPFMPAV